MTLESRLMNIARDELDWTGGRPEGPLADHFDSMQLMTLVVAVEDHFRIILEPADEDAIETLDDLLGVIERKVEA